MWALFLPHLVQLTKICLTLNADNLLNELNSAILVQLVKKSFACFEMRYYSAVFIGSHNWPECETYESRSETQYILLRSIVLLSTNLMLSPFQSKFPEQNFCIYISSQTQLQRLYT
jgi:hypothetical protein